MYFGTDVNVKNGWFTVNGKSYYSEEKRDYEDRKNQRLTTIDGKYKSDFK